MPSLSLVVTVEEANLVLDALSRLPYRDVFEVIANLRAQAERQLADPHLDAGQSPAERAAMPPLGDEA